MIVEFGKEYLKTLYVSGKDDKKHRYQPEVIRGYQKAVKLIISSKDLNVLMRYNSLNFEALKGNRTGTYSVRANGKYRVEFTLVETQSEPIITVCRIIELSNHYK